MTEPRAQGDDLSRFFDLSPDMLCVAGFDGFFKKINDSWSKTLGWSHEEILAKSLLDLAHPEDRKRMDAEVHSLAQGQVITAAETRYLCKDGRYKWFQWNAAPLPERKIIYAIARDISDRKLSEEELFRAMESMEAASNAKSEFLANMSHELRTPLNSVIGFANILLKNKSGGLKETDVTYLQRIHDNGRHLLDLINQVLDLSKVEAGKVELEFGSVSLDLLIKDTVNQMEGRTLEKNVQLLTDLPQSVAPFDTDAGKLKQVLINLIGNALKFTEKGSVTVRLHVDPALRVPVRVDVVDTGIGIPKERQQTIFEAFQQADNTTSRKYGGTGLGLTISKTLCELMGYHIEVASEPDKGSTFSVLLTQPLDEPSGEPKDNVRRAESSVIESVPTPAALAELTEDELAALRGRTVLVIDDESDSRILLSHYFSDFGLKVVTANTGEQGLRFARQHKPNLITLDLMMPKMNGWEFLRRLKQDPALKAIPVIIVSIIASDNRKTAVGVLDVINKPISRNELLRVLFKCLSKS